MKGGKNPGHFSVNCVYLSTIPYPFTSASAMWSPTPFCLDAVCELLEIALRNDFRVFCLYVQYQSKRVLYVCKLSLTELERLQQGELDKVPKSRCEKLADT